MCFMVIYGFYSFTLFFFHKRVAVAYQHLSVFFLLRLLYFILILDFLFPLLIARGYGP